MEDFLDSIWFKVMAFIHYLEGLLDRLFAPLHVLGPVVTIFVIALLTVLLTKFLSRIYKTRRFKALEAQFVYWYNLRKEALKCEDREKAKLLSKNIDQAKLNRIYYEYFFEGFLISIATKYIPILLMVAYVNETYRPASLEKLFGRGYVFTFGGSWAEPVLVGAVFWFVLCILGIYVAWSVVRRILRRRRPVNAVPPAGDTTPHAEPPAEAGSARETLTP